MTSSKRRAIALASLIGLLGSAAAGLIGGLGSCAPTADGPAARPLSAAEAERLAGMRVRNHTDGTAGVTATIAGDKLRAEGWVDWRRRLAYLRVTRPGAASALVQGVPGLVATMTEPGSASRGQVSAGPPPTDPPAGDWRVRASAGDGTTGNSAATSVDALLNLLFGASATRPDSADTLRGSDSRWLRSDTTGGDVVDVFLGPAVPPAPPFTAPAPTRLSDMGGAVRYWLGRDGDLRRMAATLPGKLPVEIDLRRGEATAFGAVAAFGGAPIVPREVTADEARLLAGLRVADLRAGGGRISVTLPSRDGALRRGEGWLDWERTRAYLLLRSSGGEAPDELMIATSAAVATRRVPAGAAGWELPPLKAPRGEWTSTPWAERSDEMGGFDLDLLLTEAMALGGTGRGKPSAVRESARHLRDDTLNGVAVGVFEIPKAAEGEVAPGYARMRYWVGTDGVLRRVELLTRAAGYAQLDLTPDGNVPDLPRPPKS
ncbi:hypothetical protein J2S43_000573 [Catenuloplanes nepalensis]|uniref:Lipoprotein n=1 Tax=Catenuloplanes nepalensis TaxID=587533 RepID=A0ABT9ML80_9ACTN|nr:hypothetical protein [Catenuloplanes nepalensis]MDP9792061.1 hypothetical protein [Catenuloplanes nepalensis]